MGQTRNNPSTAISKVAMLRARVAKAKQIGAQIRSEWLGGETGGACEIGGKRWIFLDLSLSVEEQLGQVEDALRQWEPQQAEPAAATNANDSVQANVSVQASDPVKSGRAGRSIR